MQQLHPVNAYTVTYMGTDTTTVIETELVEEGGTATPPTVEVSGELENVWYTTKTGSTEAAFTNITADTTFWLRQE